MTINIGGIDVEVKPSAATARFYKHKFNTDMFIDVQTIVDGSAKNEVDLEKVENILWAMAYGADKKIPDIDTWLEQFPPYAIRMAVSTIVMAWLNSTEPTVESKN